jgi:hypothetical protein
MYVAIILANTSEISAFSIAGHEIFAQFKDHEVLHKKKKRYKKISFPIQKAYLW